MMGGTVVGPLSRFPFFTPALSAAAGEGISPDQNV